jgi:hypothetical protein
MSESGDVNGAYATGEESAIDVRRIMAAIRFRVSRTTLRDEEAVRRARKGISPELGARISRLHAHVAGIRAHAGTIGNLPPHPPTVRGRLGAIAVRVIQRALFWLIPSLQTAQNQVAQALEDQIKINEALMKSLEQVLIRMEMLQGQPTEPMAVSAPRADA